LLIYIDHTLCRYLSCYALVHLVHL